MNTRYVCAACRLRRTSHSHQKLRRISQGTSGQQQQIVRADGHASSPLALGRYSRKAPAASGTPAVGRYSRQPLAPQRILEDLRQPASVRPEGESKVATPPARLSARYRTFMRKATLDSNDAASDAEAFAYLLALARDHQNNEQHEFSPVDSRISVTLHFRLWLARLTAGWSRDALAGSLTSTAVQPVQAARAATALEWNTFACFPALLWPLAANTLAAKNSGSTLSSAGMRAAVEQLMLAWNLAMRMRFMPSIDPLTTDLAGWSFLPDPRSITEPLVQAAALGDRYSLMKALRLVLPTGPAISLEVKEELQPQNIDRHDYPSAALATLDLLCQLQAEDGGDKWLAPYQPWKHLITAIQETARDTRVPFALAQKLRDPNSRDSYLTVLQRFKLRGQVLDHFDRSTSNSKDAVASENVQLIAEVASEADHDTGSTQSILSGHKPSAKRELSDAPIPDNEDFVEQCKAQLGRAIEYEDLRLAMRVLDTVKRSIATNGMRPALDLYEFLLHAFMSLRHREMIVPIWNDMIRAGHQPTCKTYTTLMRGCQAARDLQTMKAFWAKMRSSGIQPDHHAWSTRIFGLMKSVKHVNDGLQALAEMSREWFSAARAAHVRQTPTAAKSGKNRATTVTTTNAELLSKFPGDMTRVPRPNVHILNSAVSALAGTKRSVITQVLSWADDMRIERDLITYNALINVYMRENMPDRATGILQTMNRKGIRPDSTTWTVLLTAFFAGDTLQSLNANEVGARIMDMIRHVDAESGGLDVKGYALCIDRLLKVYQNHDAAQSIVEHMLSHGVQPTAEIYTILMTHYLEASPPDFGAAESLWSRIRSDNENHGVPLDTVFFDRMAELYAPHYATVGMATISSFLAVMESQGKKLSWRAMEVLARALVEAGEMDKVAHLADKARRERDTGPGQGGDFGQASFWNFMEVIGLVRRNLQTGAIEMTTMAAKM